MLGSSTVSPRCHISSCWFRWVSTSRAYPMALRWGFLQAEITWTTTSTGPRLARPRLIWGLPGGLHRILIQDPSDGPKCIWWMLIPCIRVVVWYESSIYKPLCHMVDGAPGMFFVMKNHHQPTRSAMNPCEPKLLSEPWLALMHFQKAAKEP